MKHSILAFIYLSLLTATVTANHKFNLCWLMADSDSIDDIAPSLDLENINDFVPASVLNPVHLACIFFRVDILRYLVLNGASVNFRCNDSKTPLIVLVETVHSRFVNHATYRVDFESRNVIIKRFKEIAEILISNGANLNMVDISGHAVLHKALMFGLVEIVEFILQKKADTTILDKDGRNFKQFIDNLWMLGLIAMDFRYTALELFEKYSKDYQMNHLETQIQQIHI